MSIVSIAKSLAKELMSTKEYQIMGKKKMELYNHPQLGVHAKKYDAKQLNIMKMKTTPAKRQSMISDLTKEYKSLMITNEMKEYIQSITSFQKKTYTIFQSLNEEINKIVNR